MRPDIHTAEVTETMNTGRDAVERLAGMVDTVRTDNDDLREALRKIANDDQPGAPAAFAEDVLEGRWP